MAPIFVTLKLEKIIKNGRTTCAIGTTKVNNKKEIILLEIILEKLLNLYDIGDEIFIAGIVMGGFETNKNETQKSIYPAITVYTIYDDEKSFNDDRN